MSISRVPPRPSGRPGATPVNGDRDAAPVVVQRQGGPQQAKALAQVSKVAQHGVDAFVQQQQQYGQQTVAWAQGGGARGLLPPALGGQAAGAPAINVRINAALQQTSAKLNAGLNGALEKLATVYKDGLVDESEMATLQQARGNIHQALALRDDPALAALDAGIRQKLDQGIFGPLQTLDAVASGEMTAVLQGLNARDRTALTEKLKKLDVQGYPNQITTLDVAAVAAGRVPGGLAGPDRYAVGDVIAVPRSGGPASAGVVVGHDKDNQLRVEVLSGGNVGLKSLTPAQVVEANPLKLGDYIPNHQGREVWVTGLGPDGQLVGKARTRDQQVTNLSAADLAVVKQQLLAELNGVSPAGVQVSGYRSSSESLSQMLGQVWEDRAALTAPSAQASNVIYSMYNAVTEPNPLHGTAQAYVQTLGQIAKARPADAVSNLQAFGGGGDSISGVADMLQKPELGDAFRSRIAGTFFRFQRANWRPDTITDRVYINANADHAPKVMQHLVKEIIDNPARFPGVEMAKISGPSAVSNRAENIVIYAAGPDAAKRVQNAVLQYQKANPDHFKSSVPHMTEQVSPGVALGQEPPARYAGQKSFGSLRADVIGAAVSEAVKQRLGQRGFEALVRMRLTEAGVDGQRPHLNLAEG